MDNYFEGARLKVERAKHHIGELNSILEKHRQSDFYDIVKKNKLQPRETFLGLKITAQPPPETSLAIGDAIHNMRAALDLTVWDYIAKAGGIPDHKTMLPFGKTKKGLRNSVKDRLGKFANTKICDLIINDIKPYRGGDDALWALHRLDIIDKHQLIIPISTITRVKGVYAKGDGGTNIINNTYQVGRNGVLCAIRSHEEFEIINKGKPSLEIFFDEESPYVGKAVVPTLKQFSDLVSETIDKFQNLGGSKP